MNDHYKKIYASYLRLLAKLIMNLDEQANGNNGFLNARLSDDMFPLKVQAKVAASFAIRACTSGIGSAGPDPGERVNNAHGLISYLNEVAEFVEKSDQPHLESVDDKAGFKSVTMETEDYINLFSLPNFFFHLSMVYAIAKNQGFQVTKGDFDGIHEYPEGFSWEA